MRTRALPALAALLLAGPPLACAPREEAEEAPDQAPLERGRSWGALESPAAEPQGITLALPPEHASASRFIDSFVGRPAQGLVTFAGPGQRPLPIYMNRFGGTFSPGPEDSRANTSIVPEVRSNISPFSGSDADWAEIMACMTSMYARFNVRVVDTEPAGGEYVEAVIGGRPEQIQQAAGVGGVAPIDPTNCRIATNGIVYVFSEVLSSRRRICEVAAQEVGHALSLDHVFYCPDTLTYLSGCGDKELRDYDSPCGEFSARACTCGRPHQNSVAILNLKVGPATVAPPPMQEANPPTVVIQSPAPDARFAENEVVTITALASDDTGIAATELVWSFSDTTYPCPYTGNGGAVSCTREGDLSTWKILTGVGARTFTVRARDLSGNENQTPPRTVHVGAIAPPMTDTRPPVVRILSPEDGATIAGNSSIVITATAGDDVGLGSVELVWSYGQDAFPCPFSGQAASCLVNDEGYRWTIQVGAGRRSYWVRAIDLAKNRVETPPRTVILSANVAPPPDAAADTVAEENDVAADAFPTNCGAAIDLVVRAGDDDWFAYDAPAGITVEVGVAARDSSVVGAELFDATGQERLAGTTDIAGHGGTIGATSRGPKVLARLTTASNAVGYRLTAQCREAIVAPPEMNDEPARGDTPGVTSDGLRGSVACTNAHVTNRGSALPGALALLGLLGSWFVRKRTPR